MPDQPTHFEPLDLDEAARRHLWMNFTALSDVGAGTPMIVSGEGCEVTDNRGRTYFDGLAGLFVVQAGHGRAELAEAGARQGSKLGYFPLWAFGHEPGVRLAERLANLAPGDLNRVFFTVSGSEAVESAWKLARQYHRAKGEPGRYKVLSRHLTYHGTTAGALAISGLPAIKAAFEPGMPGSVRVSNTYRYRCADCAHLPACTLRCADDIAMRIEMEGPETVAAVFLEPVQNTGGAIVPPEGYWARVREICDRYGVLLVSDEVICAFGRLGDMFGAAHYGYQPDLLTFAKGVTSGYAPLGGVLVSDRVSQVFEGSAPTFLHGITFGGHPVSCAVALANLDLFEREDLPGHVRANSAAFGEALATLADLPIVGEVRGEGYLRAIELVADSDTRRGFTAEESAWLLKGLLSERLLELGLICRTDDRGEAVVTLAPPLIAGPDDFDRIVGVLRTALVEAHAEYRSRSGVG